MGQKENPLIWYCDKAQRFAELINGWLFHGKACIQPEDISSEDRRQLKRSGRKKYRERYRDICKRVCGVKVRLLIGVEIQEYVQYAMPLRVMDYDTLTYSAQKSRISARHKEKNDLKDRDEFLSGFAKDDRLEPLITLVLYCGKNKIWDGAERLHELLDMDRVPGELKEYVADYPIHVLDIRHTPNERLREFPADIQALFLFIKNMDHPQKLLRKMEGISAIGADTYEVIADYAGVPEFRRIETGGRKEGEVKMCEAIRILMEESRQEGIQQQKKETEFQMKRVDEAIEQWKAAKRQVKALNKKIEELEKRLAEKS